MGKEARDFGSHMSIPHILNLYRACLVDYRGILTLAFFLNIVVVFAEGVGIAMFIPIIQILTEIDSSQMRTSGFVSMINDAVTIFPERTRLIWVLSLVIGVMMLKNGLLYACDWITSGVQYRLVRDLRSRVVEMLCAVKYGYVTQQQPGAIMYTINSDSLYAGMSFSRLMSLLRAAITIAIFGSLLLTLSWKLTIVAILLASAIGGCGYVTVYFTRKGAKQLAITESRVSEGAHELLGAMRLLRAYGQEQREQHHFRKRAHDSYLACMRKMRYYLLAHPLSEVLGVIALALILGIGSLLYRGPDAAVLFAFVMILFRMMPQVSGINQIRAGFTQDFSHAERLFALTNMSDKPRLANGQLSFRELQKDITFDRVTFSYQEHTAPALVDLSLTIPAGKVTALVGTSGSGKSTLVDLIMRLDDPRKGSIRVDGNDLRDFDIKSWRSAIGMVSQEGFLFNTTVRENIAYGKPGARDEDIRAAARRAYAEEFILELPKGYDTVVGDRGVLLSGGQKQRIAVARAIIRNPTILIFDEATSALDTSWERLVHKAIEELSQSKTIIIVAHRLSTVEQADNIVVIEKGRAVEQGSHETLLVRKGAYWGYHFNPSALVGEG